MGRPNKFAAVAPSRRGPEQINGRKLKATEKKKQNAKSRKSNRTVAVVNERMKGPVDESLEGGGGGDVVTRTAWKNENFLERE